MVYTVKEHVADVTEERNLLPPELLPTVEFVNALGIEPVWIVNEETGEIDHGSMIDTHTSQYYTFVILNSPEVGWQLIPTSDWQPCAAD